MISLRFHRAFGGQVNDGRSGVDMALTTSHIRAQGQFHIFLSEPVWTVAPLNGGSLNRVMDDHEIPLEF